MSSIYPMVPLGSVIRHRTEFIQIEDAESYKRCRVQLHAQGVVLRDAVLGAQIRTKQQQVCRAGEFLVAEIDAKHGGFGIVPGELDGAIVSSHYFLFEIDDNALDRQFLDFYIRTPNFRDQVAAQGTTNYAAIRPAHVLGYQIPLPPLTEQRRIVARIEALAAKIAEARGLRRQAVEESLAVLPSVISKTLESTRDMADEVTVQSVARSVTDGDHQPPPKAQSGIPFIFINHVVGGKITFDNCNWVAPEYFDSLAPSRVPEYGDVLYTAVGSYGVPCLVDTDEPFCFQRHIAIIKPDRDRILPKFLTWALSSSDVFDQAARVATGSAQKTVPLRGIRELRFPLPPLPEQRRIVAYLEEVQSKVDAQKRLQAETAAELDALLPAVLDKAFKGEL